MPKNFYTVLETKFEIEYIGAPQVFKFLDYLEDYLAGDYTSQYLKINGKYSVLMIPSKKLTPSQIIKVYYAAKEKLPAIIIFVFSGETISNYNLSRLKGTEINYVYSNRIINLPSLPFTKKPSVEKTITKFTPYK